MLWQQPDGNESCHGRNTACDGTCAHIYTDVAQRLVICVVYEQISTNAVPEKFS